MNNKIRFLLCFLLFALLEVSGALRRSHFHSVFQRSSPALPVAERPEAWEWREAGEIEKRENLQDRQNPPALNSFPYSILFLLSAFPLSSSDRLLLASAVCPPLGCQVLTPRPPSKFLAVSKPTSLVMNISSFVSLFPTPASFDDYFSSLVPAARQRSHQRVLGILPVRPEEKIAPSVRKAINGKGKWRGFDFELLLHREVGEEFFSGAVASLLPQMAKLHREGDAFYRLEFKFPGDRPSSSDLISVRFIVYSISLRPEVSWLDWALKEFSTSNKFAKQIIKQGKAREEVDISEDKFNQMGINGSSTIVSIGDTGLDHLNCFFSDPGEPLVVNETNSRHRKIIRYEMKFPKQFDHPDISGHGTHTAGSIAGSWSCCENPLLSSYSGIAPASRLAIFDFNDGISPRSIKPPRDIYTEYFLKSFQLGARISSNSWGARPSRDRLYIREDREIDRFVWDFPQFLPIFAAGNFGTRGLHSVVSPGLSKNSLAVGSVINSKFSLNPNEPCEAPSMATGDSSDPQFVRLLSRFSGRGPTNDFRFKPEIVAPGEIIHSARAGNSSEGESSEECPNCGIALTGQFGTSMAAAVSSGAAALVRDYFMKGFYPTGVAVTSNAFEPSGALVKAMMIAAAIPDVEDRFVQEDSLIQEALAPSVRWGWGRIQLDRVLGVPLFVHDVPRSEGISTGDLQHFCFAVKNTGPFRATLAWSDPPPDLAAERALVNDLDLAVTFKNPERRETIIPGNRGRSGVGAEADWEWDSLNPVEQVTLAPQEFSTALLTVHVHAVSVPEGPQSFALVVTGDFDELPALACREYDSLCSNSCSGAGSCSTQGICECEPEYSGLNCQIRSEAFEEETPIFSVPMGESRFFHWKSSAAGLLVAEVKVLTGALAVLVSRTGAPSWQNHEPLEAEAIPDGWRILLPEGNSFYFLVHSEGNTQESRGRLSIRAVQAEE